MGDARRVTWKQIRVGDVFTIAPDNFPDLVGFGQVVGISPGGSMLVVLHERTQSASVAPDAATAVGSPPIARIITTDGLFYHGMWKVIGREPVPLDTPFPVFREDQISSNGRVDRTDVVSWDHSLRRSATLDQSDVLTNHVSNSPIALNRILEATLAGGDWTETYPKAFPDPTTLERDYFPVSDRAR